MANVDSAWLLDTSIAEKYSLQIATLNLKHFAPFPAVRAERPY